MDHLPIFLEARDRQILIVGGDDGAARKARLACRTAGRVTVVAPRVVEDIRDLVRTGRVEWRQREFRPEDVAAAAAVFGDTGDDATDAAVSEAAKAAGVPVNIVDRPRLSTFITPAIVDRAPIVVAVSSGGKAPVLARNTRIRIEAMLPRRLGRLAVFADRFRDAVKAKFPDALARLHFWDRFFDGPVAAAVLRGDGRAARNGMLTMVNRSDAIADAAGSVHVVGAGPGDPDLLTLKALRLLQTADVIVCDRLVGDGVIDMARRDAEFVYVGKRPGHHAVGQDDINATLVRYARAGKRVVRLKGGDPFVFGRGGEEVQHLRDAGVDVHVVPGITAATGCAAAAGFPLTHRDHAAAVTLVTGHGRDGAPDVDWLAIAGKGRTLAVYMGIGRADALSCELVAGGLAAETPAVIIENGTTDAERRVHTTVGKLANAVSENEIKGPALIVVGDVVNLSRAGAVDSRPSAVAV